MSETAIVMLPETVIDHLPHFVTKAAGYHEEGGLAFKTPTILVLFSDNPLVARPLLLDQTTIRALRGTTS